uniref:Uncharacterized protein n=1 Tax=Anguilla anguilla TaxID=7936 RepID=A0A0E9PU60_ANGAN
MFAHYTCVCVCAFVNHDLITCIQSTTLRMSRNLK